MTSRDRSRARRGVVMAEAGIVYATALLLAMGTIVMGLGVFRYQELAYQAREGARWASVQSAFPSASAVRSNGIHPIALDPASLSITVRKTTMNSVDYADVTMTYQWTPGIFPAVLQPITFTNTSKQPIAP